MLLEDPAVPTTKVPFAPKNQPDVSGRRNWKEESHEEPPLPGIVTMSSPQCIRKPASTNLSALARFIHICTERYSFAVKDRRVVAKEARCSDARTEKPWLDPAVSKALK